MLVRTNRLRLRGGLKFIEVIKSGALGFINCTKSFVKYNRIGILSAFLATLVFFGPLIIRISSYSEGGDVMFNSWTLSRNHHCILRYNCPSYVDGNIYYPNNDTMLYSETQLSAGLMTLPLHFIDDNPIIANNVWTILSFFFSILFMYLLAKNLSKSGEFVSVLAGLIFAFAPFKMTGMGHLQNQSIFYLPLIVLMFKLLIDRPGTKKRYLAGAFVSLLLLFFASWYQMVFGLMAVLAFLSGMLMTRRSRWRKIGLCFIVTILAAFATLPLAKEYVRFSKSNKATFAINEQVRYSSSVKDYFIPFNDTFAGKLYYDIRPHAKINGYNPDSSSYHGITLYVLAIALFVLSLFKYHRKILSKEDASLIKVFLGVGFVGLLVSLGPLLKISDKAIYSMAGNTIQFGVALPYILVDKFLPQLSFIRAIGRASVLVLFALCCMLAFYGPILARLKGRLKYFAMSVLTLLIVFELMPTNQYRISIADYAIHNGVPNVYKYIKDNKSVDNIIILRAQNDYPTAPIPVARAEDVLWAGYHNKNIFNGYSGYEPPQYGKEYSDFVDFKLDDVAKIHRLNINYVLVDKQLSNGSSLLNNVNNYSKEKLYEDRRYALFRI